MLIPKKYFSVRIDDFISPPPPAAGIIEHFLTIISLGINTVKKYKKISRRRDYYSLIIGGKINLFYNI